MSLISTAYGELALQDAAQLFSRWSQENFLRYMMQHYAIDLLNEYRTEEIPETKRPVVNPQWRELDRQRRSVKSKLTHHQARFAALTLHPQSDEAAQSKWEKRKAELVEAIEQFDHELTGINSQLKTTPSHLDWDKLPETEKFQRLAPSRKQLVDTVKLIAYRGETALAAIVREELARTDDARSLLRDLFCSEADLLPDLEQRVLRVQVHPMSNPRANRAIAHLLEHLNAAEFTYPGTKLQLVYSIAGEAETPNSVPQQNPTDQEVCKVLIALDRKAFEHALTRWAEALLSRPIAAAASLPEAYALDGKSARGSFDGLQKAVHLLSLLAHESGLTLAQAAVPNGGEDKTNEHKAALRLLEGLVLQGRLVTGDAIFCQRDFCRQVIDAEGDYLVFVKDNQPTLLNDIRMAFAPPAEGAFSPSAATNLGSRHGHGDDPRQGTRSNRASHVEGDDGVERLSGLAGCWPSRTGRERGGQGRQDLARDPLLHHQCFEAGGRRGTVAQMGPGALVGRESFSLRT